MKLLIIISVLFCLPAVAKDIKDLNKALIQDVKKDIQKDDERFKQTSRHPASVQEVKPMKIEKPDKIEKNVKQLGHSEW